MGNDPLENLRTLDQLTAENFQAVGVEDTALAVKRIHGLAGQGVTDDDVADLLPILLEALRSSPDADRALSSFTRWFDAVGSRYSHLQTLLRHPVALELFCLVTGSSQYFADLLARQPEYFEILANPGVRGGTKTAAQFYRDVSALVDICQRPELKRDVLRRWKAREMLRIGVRDLVGLANMPATAREFSNLADACVQKAHDIALAMLPASPALPFAVIGMGKLGGQELNYSSDIDLMFVHGDDLPLDVESNGRRMETTTYLSRLAESLIKILSEETANGHVFRVDMRLRPEGRFGPLTRSLSGFRTYYENWAESWERQALLKARFVAGDRALGEAFMGLVEPFVYRRSVSDEFLEDIRANKRRIEQKCALEGQTHTNIKTGYGGIRDVEFTAQVLQLEFGGAQPHLRTPNTLSALQHLFHAHLLTETQTHELADDYQFLRTLEHRLQLLHGFQTQTLPPPSDTRERFRIARRMGFPDADRFEENLEFRRQRVDGHLQTLFYGNQAETEEQQTGDGSARWADLPELLDNIDLPAAQIRLTERLRDAGFQDIPNALRALGLPMRGNEFGGMPPDTPVEFKTIAPRLMELLERSPDPDAGLAGIEALALAVPNRAQLYAALDDSPDYLVRIVRLAAAFPPLLQRLTRHLEWTEALFSPEEADDELSTRPATDRAQEFAERMQGARSFEAKMETLARLYLRETLHIGAREIWQDANVAETMTELTALADAVLQTLLEVCAEEIASVHTEPEFARRVLHRVAILGLGKLGGAELGYASDWDVLFIYDEEHATGDAARSWERFDLANTLAQRVNSAVQGLALHGARIEMDLRLRPWGRKGAMIQTPRGLIAYYRTDAETWERQAALKARFAAGNRLVGERGVRILRAVSSGRGVTSEEDAAVQAMKRRIETERLKPGERATDLKLGFGGLIDIEWLAQRLQLRYGPQFPAIRCSNTLRALSALAAAHLLDNAEADALTASYSLLTRLRNALFLQTGTPQDVLPADARRRRALALLLGYADNSEADASARLWADTQAHMSETRRIFERRFMT